MAGNAGPHWTAALPRCALRKGRQRWRRGSQPFVDCLEYLVGSHMMRLRTAGDVNRGLGVERFPFCFEASQDLARVSRPKEGAVVLPAYPLDKGFDVAVEPDCNAFFKDQCAG